MTLKEGLKKFPITRLCLRVFAWIGIVSSIGMLIYEVFFVGEIMFGLLIGIPTVLGCLYLLRVIAGIDALEQVDQGH